MIPGIDLGGIFSGFNLLDGAGRVRMDRLLTPARDDSPAIVQGTAHLEAGLQVAVVHGATVVIDALREG